MQNIVIENLCKSYGGQEVLKDFSVEIQRGTITCLMAPSGYGKTTLLRLLMGLETPDAGRISGIENCRISAVFQEDRLCENLSAEANIRLVNRKLSSEAVRCALKQAGLEGESRQPVREFSGGMKRRAALIRALLAEYDLLILDEPFKGLDEDMKARMMRYTLECSKGRTVLMVSHDAQEARMLDAEIIRMDG